MKMFGSSGKKSANHKNHTASGGTNNYGRDGGYRNNGQQQYRGQQQNYYYDDYDEPVNEFGESREQVNATVNAYRKKRRGRKKKAVLTVLLVLVLAVVGAYFILVKAPSHSDDGLAHHGTQNTSSGADNTVTETETPATEIPEETPDYTDDGTGRKKYCYTFLVLGEDDGNKKTDTMIVGMMDVKNHVINCVSLPRDTLVNVSWKVKKINSLYYGTDGVGDVDRLMDGIKNIFGYSIDQYAVVNLEAFSKLVDAVGGIYYDVPFDMQYYDPAQNLDINIKAGYQLLDGENALKVVRFRLGVDENGNARYPMGDIDRIKTQQDFLMTAAKQMLTLGNIPNIGTAAEIFEEYVNTSLTAGNIAWYAKEFLKVSSDNINFMTLPGDYSCTINGTSYVEIKEDEWLEMLNTYFNPYYEEITSENLNLLFYNESNGALYSNTGTVAGGEYSY